MGLVLIAVISLVVHACALAQSYPEKFVREQYELCDKLVSSLAIRQ